MHAGIINSLGVEIEADVPDRLPAGIPYSVAATRTNIRLIGKEPRIPPLDPKEWTPEQRKRFDPNGTGQRIVAGPDSGGGDPLETAMLRATDELYRDDVVSADTWGSLAKALDSKQLLDLLVAVGGYRAVSMAINSAGVQLDANMADFRFPPSLR